MVGLGLRSHMAACYLFVQRSHVRLCTTCIHSQIKMSGPTHFALSSCVSRSSSCFLRWRSSSVCFSIRSCCRRTAYHTTKAGGSVNVKEGTPGCGSGR